VLLIVSAEHASVHEWKKVHALGRKVRRLIPALFTDQEIDSCDGRP
jgi:hypothetical protein